MSNIFLRHKKEPTSHCRTQPINEKGSLRRQSTPFKISSSTKKNTQKFRHLIEV